MGALIDDEEQAVRLARAIFSDIALYNEERIRNARALPDDLAAEIAEARALFTSRVSTTHHAVFETRLAEFIRRVRPDLGSESGTEFGSSANVPDVGSAEAAYRRAAAREAEARSAPSMPSTSGGTAVTLASVAVVVGAVALWFVLHR